jgi:hypothetical protein
MRHAVNWIGGLVLGLVLAGFVTPVSVVMTNGSQPSMSLVTVLMFVLPAVMIVIMYKVNRGRKS